MLLSIGFLIGLSAPNLTTPVPVSGDRVSSRFLLAEDHCSVPDSPTHTDPQIFPVTL